jgi:hypothetical protein
MKTCNAFNDFSSGRNIIYDGRNVRGVSVNQIALLKFAERKVKFESVQKLEIKSFFDAEVITKKAHFLESGFNESMLNGDHNGFVNYAQSSFKGKITPRNGEISVQNNAIDFQKESDRRKAYDV